METASSNFFVVFLSSLGINPNYLILLLKGTALTFGIYALSIILGLFIGIVFLVLQKSKIKTISYLTEGLLIILRGLPELIVIFLIFFGGTQLILMLTDSYVDVSPFLAGTIALALIFGAYASQTLRGAIEAIPLGQWESALALGLNKPTTFFGVVLPQVWRLAIPGLSNQMLTTLKDTSLISLIGIADVLFYTKAVVQVSHKPFTYFTIAALIYLIFTILSKYLIKKIQAYFDRYTLKLAKENK